MFKLKIVLLATISAAAIGIVFSLVADIDMNNPPMPDLALFKGEGKVIYIEQEKTTENSADIKYVSNFSFNEKQCEGLTFNSSVKENIVGIASCTKNNYFICAGGLDHCIKGIKTKKKNNTLQYRSNFNGNRYSVEFYPNQIIYKIQEKKCLIPYPHGCLINSFGWKDDYSFIFSLTK